MLSPDIAANNSLSTMSKMQGGTSEPQVRLTTAIRHGARADTQVRLESLTTAWPSYACKLRRSGKRASGWRMRRNCSTIVFSCSIPITYAPFRLAPLWQRHRRVGMPVTATLAAKDKGNIRSARRRFHRRLRFNSGRSRADARRDRLHDRRAGRVWQ